jgi:periplasmic protein TonB
MATFVPVEKARNMPMGQRYRIAVVVSACFHVLLLLLVGYIATHSKKAPMEPIQIELETVEMTTAPKLEPPPQLPTITATAIVQPQKNFRAQAAVKPVERVAVRPDKPGKGTPSNAGGPLKRGVGAPPILTSKGGSEPSGSVAKGTATEGLGGQVEEPGGPTYGPSTAGGPMPIYPKTALDQGLEGKVTLAVTISDDGGISSIAVQSSSGHKVLDDAAIRAVQKGWSFKSGMNKGKAATGKVLVTIDFSAGKVK